MAKSYELKPAELIIVSEALVVYGGEIGKLMKKAEKLNIKEASSLKSLYLDIAAMRDRLTRDSD